MTVEEVILTVQAMSLEERCYIFALWAQTLPEATTNESDENLRHLYWRYAKRQLRMFVEDMEAREEVKAFFKIHKAPLLLEFPPVEAIAKRVHSTLYGSSQK